MNDQPNDAAPSSRSQGKPDPGSVQKDPLPPPKQPDLPSTAGLNEPKHESKVDVTHEVREKT